MTLYVSYEQGIEGTFTENEMIQLYNCEVDKDEYQEFDSWIYDMLKSGVFEKTNN